MPDTPEDRRQAFEMLLRMWQERLNLRDWSIHLSPAHAVGAAADVVPTSESRQAIVRLATRPSDRAHSKAELQQLAVHELLHVLLHDLIEVSRRPRASDAAINAAEHRVINTLTSLLTEGTP